MPLSGNREEDIRELMRTYERTGKIGTSRPETKAEALKQALAAAHNAARKKKKSRR